MREWVVTDFGIDLVELTRVHGGADLSAEVWRGSTDRGDRYAVKRRSGGGTAAGAETTAYLAGVGVRGVPAPVRTSTGELWSQRDGKRLSLAPWIPGARAAETGLTTEQWTSYGALLAEVHYQEPPPRLRELLPPLNPINARMPALTRELDHRLTTQPPADDLEAELAKTWQSHRETITALLERSAITPTPGRRVICHADPHLGNVLVTPDQLHLIDWDDAVLASIEQDLLFMLGGMGTLGPTTQAAQEAFFTGYGPADLDPTRLTYYRSARALEDVALWAEQVITGPDRGDCLAILQAVLSPDGLAVRALTSGGLADA